eukprot:TRINITY_DN23143_c0_g1_i1.p1 TRINITY_DN23143_c0_g1~~TRINITY_DN23143_c0_g1_i1.p1  ORF type:complete len:247 (+),score=62.98 TRINITY_DN23143_c0_g1_i1:67-741(+)
MPKRIDMKTLGRLKNDTNLSKPQIKRLHNRFREISEGKWTINKEQFYAALKESGVYTNDDSETGKFHASDWRFIESFFDSLDRDNQGKINFREFCSGISVFATGNLGDSLECIFEMYNLAGDDRITEEEMLDAISSMSGVLNLDHFTPGSVDTEWVKDGAKLRIWVKQVVEEADVSKTGSLSYDEFHAAVAKHPLLQEMASQFVTECCKDFFHLRHHSHHSHSK